MNLATKATMSSLEMVEFINSTREEGASELTHANFLKKVPLVLAGGEVNFYSSYLSSQNKELPCYNFPKREAMLMAMSYSYKLQSKVYDHMTALEEQLKSLVVPVVDAAKEASALLGLAEVIANNFRMCESAKLGLSRRMLQQHTPMMVEYLPIYAIDAPPNSNPPLGSLVSHSLSHLLSEYDIKGSAMSWNKKLATAGFLKQEFRKSTRSLDKPYWSITEKGAEYGKNLVNEKSPNETQPYWYDATFLKLIESVK